MRPFDSMSRSPKIRHKTGPAGAKVVVIWVPGEEAKRIVSRWTKEP
jgi:hypothetical protein